MKGQRKETQEHIKDFLNELATQMDKERWTVLLQRIWPNLHHWWFSLLTLGSTIMPFLSQTVGLGIQMRGFGPRRGEGPTSNGYRLIQGCCFCIVCQPGPELAMVVVRLDPGRVL